MFFSKLSRGVAILTKRGWREVLIRLDDFLHTNYFDFSFVTVQELGLDPQQSIGHRASGSDVCQILNGLPILPNSAIIDVGSGKGRAMLAMSGYPFKRIGGIEISPDLAQIARRNLSRAFLTKRSEVFVSSASDFDEYDAYNYFYFYNPFSFEIFSQAFTHIHSSLRTNPRNSWIIYNAAGSTDEEEIICKDGFFRRVLDFNPKGRRPIVAYYHEPKRQLAELE